MKRREFIKTCGAACIGATLFSVLLESCGASKSVNATIEGSDLLVPLSDFEKVKDGEKQFRKYVIVHHDILQNSICVYRFNESDYSALLMRCPHQGAELQVFGDKLQCTAHGSEFSGRGEVQNGPADSNLRSFPIQIENNRLKISLK